MGQSITSGCMLLHGLSQRDPPVETPRQQAGRKHPEDTDLETRGDNWRVGGGGGRKYLAKLFPAIIEAVCVYVFMWTESSLGTISYIVHGAYQVFNVCVFFFYFTFQQSFIWDISIVTRTNTNEAFPQYHCLLHNGFNEWMQISYKGHKWNNEAFLQQ